MKLLAPVKIGWIGKTINTLIEAINARTISVPIGGGLDFQETNSGVLLSVSRTNATPVSSSAGGDATNLASLTARVAALEAILAGSNWTGVDVMDSSCVRSTIQVLTK